MMKWEHTAIIILSLGVVAVILFRVNAPNTAPASVANPGGSVDTSNTPDNTPAAQGREYLLYNQGPWAFAPPVMNFLPSFVAPGGTAVNVAGRFGCTECD